MKVIDTLIEMEKMGYLQELCRGGLISPSISFYKEIYLFVDARKQCGFTRMQALNDAEEKFRIRKTTIYKAMKIMSKVSAK